MRDSGKCTDKNRFEKDCVFCTAVKKGLLTQKILSEDPKTPLIDCNRGFYKNSKCCIVTLAPEQLSKGHTLVILKNHAKDMSDDVVTPEEYADICNTIREVSKLLKLKLGAKRIYVCSLCDGVEHLHFHLIPRYETDVRGFCHMGDREKIYNMGITIGEDPGPSDCEKRAKWIESIADKLRN
jgi:diadenosine tetraphosphate (Ap4A) HIT family hydrolase